MRRGKTRDLDVVAHQIIVGRQRVDLAAEKLLLSVPARAPGEDAADIKVLAQDVPPHVLGLDPLGRAFIVAQPAAWTWWSPEYQLSLAMSIQRARRNDSRCVLAAGTVIRLD